MKTQMEMKLEEARSVYEEMAKSLWRGGLKKYFAEEDYELFLEELDYLMDEIDEMLLLAASARSLIREARAVRRMLLDNGSRLESTQTIQFLSHESAIAEKVLSIQERKDGKVVRIGRILKNYNKRLRLFLETRESGFDRVWMNWANLPTVDDFPSSLSLNLLSEFYEDDIELFYHAPAATEEDHYHARRNGTQDKSQPVGHSRQNGTHGSSQSNGYSRRNGAHGDSHSVGHDDSQEKYYRKFLAG